MWFLGTGEIQIGILIIGKNPIRFAKKHKSYWDRDPEKDKGKNRSPSQTVQPNVTVSLPPPRYECVSTAEVSKPRLYPDLSAVTVLPLVEIPD